MLAGLIERVTFHSPANGFCVLRIKDSRHRDRVTALWGSGKGKSLSSSSPWGRAWWSAAKWSASAAEDVYPKGQFECGKKLKWTDYDCESTEALETTFSHGGASCQLEIDWWPYEVQFADMVQTSETAQAKLRVRRLTEPPAAGSM